MLLSVLDYAVVDSGRTSQEALGETVALAQLADELGYHRFWVNTIRCRLWPAPARSS